MRNRHGFTLTELFVAIGAIAVLASLVVPVASKARAAANAASCLSNLRQMGAAFTMYEMENQSALVQYSWSTTSTLHPAYNEYWFGILDHYGVRAEGILCPSANSPLFSDPFTPAGRATLGYGTAFNCWTGQFGPNGTAITLVTPIRNVSSGIYRNGSYGYNHHLTSQSAGLGGWGTSGNVSSLLQIHDLGNIPAFMDCVFADVGPDNYSATVPQALPNDLSGVAAMPGQPGTAHPTELWKLLIARHGTAINVGMADGSARLVPLTDLFMLTWNAGWQKYPLKIQ